VWRCRSRCGRWGREGTRLLLLLVASPACLPCGGGATALPQLTVLTSCSWQPLTVAHVRTLGLCTLPCPPPQVEMMLLDVFLEGLFEMDLRRVNSEEVRQLGFQCQQLAAAQTEDGGRQRRRPSVPVQGCGLFNRAVDPPPPALEHVATGTLSHGHHHDRRGTRC
jgi:hypothetical protein